MESGFVVVLIFRNGQWTILGNNIVANSANGETFGYSISLSSNGTMIAIGGNRRGVGVARVFAFNETSNQWTQVGSNLENAAVGVYNSATVSMSGDGSMVVVGGREYAGRMDTPIGNVRLYRFAPLMDNESRPAVVSSNDDIVLVEASMRLEFDNANELLSTSLLMEFARLTENWYLLQYNGKLGTVTASRISDAVPFRTDTGLQAISYNQSFIVSSDHLNGSELGKWLYGSRVAYCKYLSTRLDGFGTNVTLVDYKVDEINAPDSSESGLPEGTDCRMCTDTATCDAKCGLYWFIVLGTVCCIVLAIFVRRFRAREHRKARLLVPSSDEEQEHDLQLEESNGFRVIT